MSKGSETAPPKRDDGEAAGSGEPTEQELFDILSNRRRRYALYALLRDETTTIGALADQIAAWENDCPVADVTAAERKRVYTALQQSHLPKLERTGLIGFDPDSGRIRPTDAVDELNFYLEVVGEEQLSWNQYYLALAAISGAVAAAVWVGVPPFGAVSPLIWLTVVVALFGVSSAVHNYRSTGLSGATKPPEVRRRS
jgi:hypothetical protein